jgi:glycosyltransferase involved in cell wall biosynthesis
MAAEFSFCFVSPYGYAALARDPTVPFVGGAEVQQSFLAPELVRRGHRVSMVTMDFGQRHGMNSNGVTILNSHQPTAGVPALRFVHPRLTSTWSAMKEADADFYYQRGAGALTGMVAAFVRRHGRRFIFAAASDQDFDPKLGLVRYARDRAICRYGLRRADAVVVQTERQRLACGVRFGQEGVLVPSCYRLDGASAQIDGPILWVGTVRDYKRPDLLLQVAARMPGRRFVMIGGSGAADRTYYQTIQREAIALGNVDFRGPVPFSEIEPHFDRGAMLLNTSTFEGFPNTFLQAWSRGMPTVSFFDPQMVHQGRAVACIATDVDSMVRQIESLLGSVAAWTAQSEVVRGHFERHHGVEVAASILEGVAAGLVAKQRRDRRP